MSNPEPSTRTDTTDWDRERTAARLDTGEAWMMCNECGAKLWSFDGDKDADRPCPYRRNGRCEPR